MESVAGWLTFKTKIDNKTFEKQINDAERKLEELEFEFEALSKADPYSEQENDLRKLQTEIEKTKNKLTDLNAKQNKINNEGFDNVKNSLSSIIKHVSRWGISLFSIYGVYSAIRSSASTLSQYNEELSNQLTNIQYSLATALEPVITRLVSLVYTLMQYVNYLSEAWFGVSIFSTKAASASTKAAKAASSAAKSMSAAGFDEINKVSSVASEASSGGATAGYTPTGISELPQGKVPEWLQWMADNGDLVKLAIEGIAGAIFILTKNVGALILTGIFTIIDGTYNLIKDIVDFVKDPSWEKFSEILFDISEILLGISLILIAINVTNPVGWIILAIAAITALVAVIIKNWDKIKEVLGKVASWIDENIIQPIASFFTDLWDGIKNGVETAIKWIKDKFNAIISFFSGLIGKIVSTFKNLGTKVGDAIGGAFKLVINGILSAIENILNFPIKSVNKLLDVINKVPGIKISKLSTFSLPRLAVGGIVNMPGKGINYGGANIGERGAEGVIPLTNSQAMSMLGQEIAKYVNINNVINNNMDSRRINRTLAKSSNRDAIMSNG